jgi:hypothetical protein
MFKTLSFVQPDRCGVVGAYGQPEGAAVGPRCSSGKVKAMATQCNGTKRSGGRCERSIAEPGTNCGQCIAPAAAEPSTAMVASLAAQANHLEAREVADLSEWAPPEVDREIARLSFECDRTKQKMGSLTRMNVEYAKRPYYASALERNQAELQVLGSKLSALRGKLEPYLDEYSSRPWTRAFVVPGGHVHSSMECSTCYPTTAFSWLPDYSGADESKIVEDAGERACTICYPSAPVEVLSRPTKIYSDEERKDLEAKAARAAELARKRNEKSAKAISAPDGQPLYVTLSWGYKDRIATEVTARRKAGDAILEAERARTSVARLSESDHPSVVEKREQYASRLREEEANLQRIAEAIAAKHGRVVEEVEAELRKAAEPKLKKWRRDGCW